MWYGFICNIFSVRVSLHLELNSHPIVVTAGPFSTLKLQRFAWGRHVSRAKRSDNSVLETKRWGAGKVCVWGGCVPCHSIRECNGAERLHPVLLAAMLVGAAWNSRCQVALAANWAIKDKQAFIRQHLCPSNPAFVQVYSLRETRMVITSVELTHLHWVLWGPR